MVEDIHQQKLSLLLKPGTLWTRTLEQTSDALQCGALESIPTSYEWIEQNGIRFLVRKLTHLVRKDEAKQQQVKQAQISGQEFNPFLPYEQDLFVTDVSSTHLCLLNKYNVVDHHLLIVTREFESQENWLTVQDFEAMWQCLAEIDGLVFYNGGKQAGASQRHKHLQLVPLPLLPDGTAQLPFDPAIAAAQFHEGIGTSPLLPFVHAIAPLDPAWMTSPYQGGQATVQSYRLLLQRVGLLSDSTEMGVQQTGPYNLLATKNWMMVIPRFQEEFEGIPVNALGFAGAMLVRNEQQLQQLKEIGPLTILQKVAAS